jgi:thiol-disulfide isomerase/thioredoxin
MTCRFFVLGIAFFVAFSAPGAGPEKLERLVVGTKTYSNVTILGTNATDLYFTYDQGMANAKLKYLEPAMQEHFHYDAELSSLVEKQQIEDEARYVASMSAKLAADVAAQAEKAIQAARKAASTYDGSLADPYMDTSLIGKPAPQLEVEKWLDEKPSVEGKFVLIDFWAPWSFACRRYIPGLNELQKKFAGRLVVVGLTSDAEPEVRAMVEPPIAFPSAIDSKAKVATAAGVTSIPTLMLVDPRGVVRYQGHPAAINEGTLGGLLSKFAEEPK